MSLEQADTRKSGVLSEHSSQSPANALVQTPIAMAAAAILTPERMDDLSHLRSLAVRHDRTALDQQSVHSSRRFDVARKSAIYSWLGSRGLLSVPNGS